MGFIAPVLLGHSTFRFWDSSRNGSKITLRAVEQARVRPMTAQLQSFKNCSLQRKIGAGLLALAVFVQAPALPTHALPPPIMDREHEIVEEVMSLVRTYYVDPVYHGLNWDQIHDRIMTKRLNSRSDTYRTIRATLSDLGDNYTRLLSPDDMQRLRKYDVSGVGLLLTANSKGELIVASEPVKSSAAGQSELKQGLVVTSIDGVSLLGRGAFQAAELMQGEEGSTMKVGVREPDGSNVREVYLKRSYAESGGAPVLYSLEEVNGRKVGYVQLSDFSAGSRGDVANALRALDSKGATAYILDLRGNPGGVFEGALEIAGLLEGKDAVVARVASRANSDEVFRSRLVAGTEGKYTGGAVVSPDAPLAVLVDGGSASSSEVLAGSLRDNCRGVIAGNGHSYGKGLIQGVFGLSDGGGVVITVASYRTPSGRNIQGTGVSATVPFADGLLDHIARAFRKQGPASGVDFKEVEEGLHRCRADGLYGPSSQWSWPFPADRFGV